MAEPVDWDLAERVAVRVSGREPFSGSYHYDSLAPDFAELTALAEELVEAETGLRSLDGPATARLTDRAGWIRANVASFQRLLRPVTDRLAERMPVGGMAPLARRAAGLEVGMLLGWMSARVLGQYDMLVVDDDDAGEQDVVYYVGPNVLALEKRFAFPPRDFRLWLALHEVTHRAQFTGVPWMREHYLSLIDKTLSNIDPDPKRFIDAVLRVLEDVRSGRSPFEDGGVVTLLANDDQRAAIQKVGGLMSLLEGHGDVTMDRAGIGHVLHAERFSRVLRERRNQARGMARLVQRLVGLEAKLNQYEQGERFIAAIEAARGPRGIDAVWRGPEWLPTLEEIRDPQEWIERAALSEELVT